MFPYPNTILETPDTFHPSAIFDDKAQVYAKYRWSYARDAIDFITRTARLNSYSTIADIGSGTGILAKEFVERVKRVYGVEPNSDMREQAETDLFEHANYLPIDSCCEQTKLKGHSVDLVTAAHSLHWCDAPRAREEFLRILRPGGWLAIIYNVHISPELDRIWQEAMEEAGFDFSPKEKFVQDFDPNYFFPKQEHRYERFPFMLWHSLETWIGVASSVAFAPKLFDPRYEEYVDAATKVFYQISQSDILQLAVATVVRIGRID